MSYFARHVGCAILFAVAFALSPLAAGAADIVTEWGSVKVIAQPVFSRGLSSRVKRMAWTAPIARRLAVSRVDRMSA